MKKLALSTFVTLFILSVSTAYALPPRPPIGGQPAGPNQPQVPNQPQLPPCVECDQFTQEQPTPTAKPTTSANPTPTTTAEAPHPQPCNGCGGGNGPSGQGGAPVGQVLGLSATSGEGSLETFATLLGVVCIVFGLKITTRKLAR